MSNMTIENIGQFIQKSNVGETLSNQTRLENLNPSQNSESGASKTFSEMLNESVEKVDELQKSADKGVKELVAGRDKNIHETMLMMEKADISFRMMMQVRNKMIEAYREIMRMQV